MATGSESQQNAQISKELEEKPLKYLEFVQVAVLQAAMCFAWLYGYAKENAGPLKPGVQTVEGTVKTVVGPIYEKFHDVPLELLKFFDCKVGQSVHKVEHYVPSCVKDAYAAAQKAPDVACSVVGDVHRAGVAASVGGLARAAYSKWEPAAKELYAKYEPSAEHYAVSVWRSLNRLPLVPEVAQVVLPKAALLSERYNQAVCSAVERGYAVPTYMPLVPTERIAKVFGSDATAAEMVAVQ